MMHLKLVKKSVQSAPRVETPAEVKPTPKQVVDAWRAEQSGKPCAQAQWRALWKEEGTK